MARCEESKNLWDLHGISNDPEQEDSHGKRIAAIERIAPKELRDGLVMVLCRPSC